MAQEQCQVCNETGYDRRTLFMSCFYDMSELGLPFDTIELDNRQFFTLRVCKGCRAKWMQVISDWFNAPRRMNRPSGTYCSICNVHNQYCAHIKPPSPTSIGTGIFVRKLGVAQELRIETREDNNNNG